MLVGFAELALLEGLAAQQELCDAVLWLDLDQRFGKLDGAVPMRRGGLQEEGLLEDDLVGRVLSERFGIEVGRRNGVMVATRHAARKVVAKQRAGVRMLRLLRDHLRISCRSGEDGDDEQRAPRPEAQGRVIDNRHIVSAFEPPQTLWKLVKPSPEGLRVFRWPGNPKASLGWKGGAFVAAFRDTAVEAASGSAHILT